MSHTSDITFMCKLMITVLFLKVHKASFQGDVSFQIPYILADVSAE